ncbi:metal ABC transporter ATP-binding protein [bacterium]|nr:metal ABC transporter ATP-binding protein [bacterium]
MISRPAVQIENLSVKFNGMEILKNIHAHIEHGCITAIIGPNGAGKTTLLSALLGLVPCSGIIRFLNENGDVYPPRLAYVPQNLEFDRQSPVTVLDFIALRHQKKPLWMGLSRSTIEASQEALEKLKVSHLLRKPIGKLSGGEIQRVLLAIALRDNPELLLLDEPISGVDVAGGHLFCDILEKLRRQRQLTIVMVSHDLSVVSQHADRVICLNRSVVCEGTTVEVLTSENLFAIYGLHAGLYEYETKNPPIPCDYNAKDKTNSSTAL